MHCLQQNRLLRRHIGADGPEQAVEALLGMPLPNRGGFQERVGVGGLELSLVLPRQVSHPAPCSRRGGEGIMKRLFWYHTNGDFVVPVRIKPTIATTGASQTLHSAGNREG